MDVDENVIAEAAEYLLAAFYRSKPTGLRWENVDPLEVNGEFDNFIRKVSFKVRILVQTVGDGDLHVDRVCLSTSTTCRPQDLLIIDDRSAVVEARQRGVTDQALSMSSIEDPSLPGLSAQGPELLFPPPSTTPTLDLQLEDIRTHQPTSDADQRPQENEHNGMRTAPFKEPRQLGSSPRSEKSRKRRLSGIAPVQNHLRARKKPAVTYTSAQSTQSCSEFDELMAKLASPRVVIQLREMLGKFPMSRISFGLNVSDVGIRDLFVRIIERDNVSRGAMLGHSSPLSDVLSANLWSKQPCIRSPNCEINSPRLEW